MGRLQRITDQDTYAARNHERGFKFGFFDLETSGLNAAFDKLLCGSVIGVDDKDATTWRLDEQPSYKTERWSDRSLAIDIRDGLEEYDVLIAYNSFKFDVPFLNSRLIINNQKILDIRVKHVDLLMVPRHRMRFNSNSLQSVQTALHLQNRKTALSPEIWRRACDGDKKSFNYVVEHNIADVKALRELFFRLKNFLDIQFRLIR